MFLILTLCLDVEFLEERSTYEFEFRLDRDILNSDFTESILPHAPQIFPTFDFLLNSVTDGKAEQLSVDNCKTILTVSKRDR